MPEEPEEPEEPEPTAAPTPAPAPAPTPGEGGSGTVKVKLRDLLMGVRAAGKALQAKQGECRQARKARWANRKDPALKAAAQQCKKEMAALRADYKAKKKAIKAIMRQKRQQRRR